MAEINYTVLQSTLDGVGYENYSTEDRSVVDSFEINSAYDESKHNIELHIYGLDGTLLDSNLSYRGAQQLQGAENGANLSIDPERDALQAGYDQGDVKLLYNFLNNISPEEFFIQEISADRTELRVFPVSPTFDATAVVAEIKQGIPTGAYFNEFRLNFGGNDLLIGLNIDIKNSVLIKLYEPLPSTYAVKSRFTFDEIVSDSVVFEIQAEFIPDAPVYPTLRGANFNIDTGEERVQPTEYFDYNDLYSFDVTSSLHGVITQLSSSGVELSIDYTDYENFIHFSSAEERLRNFHYKMGLLEQYNYSASISATYQPQYDNLTKGIISKFDDYEKYLYFKSGSKAWPKTNANIPYINDTVSNSTSWFNEQVASASLYDELNESRLTYTVPEFIREDSSNAPYNLFLDMIGQHFDNLWIYSKAMTDKYDADNRLDVGVSKDLIRDVLKSFGVKLYSSNFSVSNLAASFIGEFYQSGSEQINTFVTASNDPTPDKDILSETYKRIYHNLPYLIKTKGTERGLRALINCFGIPSGSLTIDTYGGNTRNEINYTGYYVPTDEDKIRLNNTGSIVSGNTLSQFVSIQTPSETLVQDLHVIDVGFSPSTHINNWLLEQFNGSYSNPDDYATPYLGVAAYVLDADFNIDEYIGDPTLLSETQYRDLTALGELYLGSQDRYDIFDFVRLIKFFDIQLFKMIKDFVPARSSVNTGVIIKPHFLNRSKIKSPVPTWTRPEYSGSIDTAFATGSEGGVIPSTVSTAYTASFSTLSGSVNKIIDNNSPQFNGELGGSTLTVTTQDLNSANEYKVNQQPYTTYNVQRNTLALLQLPGWVDTFRETEPAAGQFKVRYLERDTGGIPIQYEYDLLDGTIHKTSSNSVDVNGALNRVTVVYVLGKEFIVDEIQEFANHYYFKFIKQVDVTRVATTSNADVVFRNYVAKLFYNSDYNVLVNNATNARKSTTFVKVDYNSGILPSNLNYIQTSPSGNIELQESNYSSNAYTDIRYNGSYLQGQQVNEYTPGDKSYGETPVIERMSKYFGYAESAERLDPLIVNKTQYTTKYLIDAEESVVDLSAVTDAYLYTRYNFEQGSSVQIQLQDPLYNGGNSYYLNGTKKVHKAGLRAEYLAGTETTLGVFTSSIDFPSEGNVTDYGFLATSTINQAAPGGFTQLSFAQDYDAPSYYASNTYTFGEDSEAQVVFRVQGTFQNDRTQAHDFTIRIKRNSTVIATKTLEVAATSTLIFDLANNYQYFSNTDDVTVEFYSTAGVLGVVKAGAEFDLVQNPVPKLTVQKSGMWTTGSANGNSVTSSAQLASVYGTRIQAPNYNTAFPSASLPFTVEVGDEFRFDGNEVNTYIVTDVVKSGKVYVKFDKTVPPQINILNFTHRRYVDDASSIITNQKKIPGVVSPVYITPKYTTPDLKRNIEGIVKNLKSKNLL